LNRCRLRHIVAAIVAVSTRRATVVRLFMLLAVSLVGLSSSSSSLVRANERPAIFGNAAAALGSPARLPPVERVLRTPAQGVMRDEQDAALQRAFLDRYCVTCHNDKLQTGSLTLATSAGQPGAGRGEVWEKVIRKLRTGAMPPAGASRPEKSAAEAFLSSVEQALDRASAVHPNPGRPMALHRLNRTEYYNAVRDLFDVELNAEDTALLPTDDSSYGFDNIADVLGMPPLLLERYLSVARRVTRAALGTATSDDVDIYTHRVSRELVQSTWLEGLPFGTRGGTLFTHQFPVDGEYSIRVRLQRDLGDGIVGLRRFGGAARPEPERMEIVLDHERQALFAIGADKTVREDATTKPTEAPPAQEPTRKPTSEELTEQALHGDAGLEARLFVSAGTKRIGVTFLAKPSAVAEQVREPSGAGGSPRVMAVDHVIVSGPFKVTGAGDTSSRRRILICRPRGVADEHRCGQRILGTLARRAYRRPVTSEELHILLTTFLDRRKVSDFDGAIGFALRRMLMDPAFLFRIEQEPSRIAPNTPYRISDLELASRLSFFLWSSIPDDELLQAAERGGLKDSVVLEQQVRRMLRDRRARSLVTSFAAQWLSLRAVGGAKPDLQVFADFDENLRRAFQRETELLLDTVLLGDRSVLDLLDANYTFVNERLARHYGIPGVYGDHFRRVTVTDGVRGGLLGQGGILTATAFPTRTSPVLRGKWILENILGSPPPPPPPDIPPLPEVATNGKVLTMRERLAEHRKNPGCASCHARMDPLGFALENYDAIGKWRTVEATSSNGEGGHPIDATGQLADGTTFDGAKGLRNALKGHHGEFVYTMTERLLTYALGRGVEAYDAPAIRQVVRDGARADYRFSALVLGIVRSLPFQMRMSRDTASTSVN
jgi:hypothetical protein